MKANIKRARLEAAKRRGRLLKVCQMAHDLAAQAEAHPAFQVAKVRTQSQRVRKHCAEVFAFAGVSGDIGDEARARTWTILSWPRTSISAGPIRFLPATS